jgi:hypothetical protein
VGVWHSGRLYAAAGVHGLVELLGDEPGDRVRLAADGLGAIEARVVAGRPAPPLRPGAGR